MIFSIRVQSFLRADDGAITVDWLILTAALTGIALAIMVLIFQAIGGPRDTLKAQLLRDDLICHDFCQRPVRPPEPATP